VQNPRKARPKMLAVAEEVTRDELIRRLADVSHKTWIKQKVRDQGAVEDDLAVEVADHDLERAEDTVQELERLGIWPR
jgi:hypothetical protein